MTNQDGSSALSETARSPSPTKAPRRRRRALLFTTSLLLGGLPIALPLACSSHAAKAGPGTLRALEEDTGVSWATALDPSLNNVFYLFPTSSPPAPTAVLDPGTRPSVAALAFLRRYGAIFGIVDPDEELVLAKESSEASEPSASFTQVEGPAAVFGSRLTVEFDEFGRVRSVIGVFVPNLHGFSTVASVSAARAASIALSDVKGRLVTGARPASAATSTPKLTIEALKGSAKLAYRLTASFAVEGGGVPADAPTASIGYAIDATSGDVIDALWSPVYQYTAPNAVEIQASGIGERFNVRTFSALATGGAGHFAEAPFYLQENGAKGPKVFARIGDAGVVSSPSQDSWDTKATLQGIPSLAGHALDPGSAVDAYAGLTRIDAWWRSHGRQGWDDQNSPVYVRAHSTTMLGGVPCTNNAFWNGSGEIVVCAQDLANPQAKPPGASGAASVDLGIMAHEYQHAVNEGAFGHGMRFGGCGEPAAVDESLADTYAELILHDEDPANARCIFGTTWVPGTGLRNLVNPLESAYPGPQPDFYHGPNYGPSPSACGSGTGVDVHQNAGVATKAWSLLTFGGHDNTHPERKVDPSLALGWQDSETLYLGLVRAEELSDQPTFIELAGGLDAVAAARFGLKSHQRIASACAWYAVGVIDEANLKSWGGADPCNCNSPQGDSCDAGTPADDASATDPGSSDAGTSYQSGACVAGPASSPVECLLQVFAGSADRGSASLCPIASDAGSPAPSCPAAGLLGCCTTMGNSAPPVQIWEETCYYKTYVDDVAHQVDASPGDVLQEFAASCTGGAVGPGAPLGSLPSGRWTSTPWYPDSPGKGSPSTDSGPSDDAGAPPPDATAEAGPSHC